MHSRLKMNEVGTKEKKVLYISSRFGAVWLSRQSRWVLERPCAEQSAVLSLREAKGATDSPREAHSTKKKKK